MPKGSARLSLALVTMLCGGGNSRGIAETVAGVNCPVGVTCDNVGHAARVWLLTEGVTDTRARGSLGGMTAAKIAISLPEPLEAHVRREVRRGRAASVSAYIAHAVAQQAQNDDLTTMLDELLAASGGPMTRSERAWADDALGLEKRRKR